MTIIQNPLGVWNCFKTDSSSISSELYICKIFKGTEKIFQDINPKKMHNISHSYVVPGNKTAGISGHAKERKFPGLLQHTLTTLSE